MTTYEVIRYSEASGFQRRGHIHRSEKAAEECRDKLNRESRKDKNWRVVGD